MKLIGVKAGKLAKISTVVAMTALSAAFFPMTSANAAEITDTASCNSAVQAIEAKIVKTEMAPDAFNKVVADADSAKAACSAGDFGTASKLIASINSALATASQ